MRFNLRLNPDSLKKVSNLQVSDHEINSWDQDVPPPAWSRLKHQDVERILVPKVPKRTERSGKFHSTSSKYAKSRPSPANGRRKSESENTLQSRSAPRKYTKGDLKRKDSAAKSVSAPKKYVKGRFSSTDPRPHARQRPDYLGPIKAQAPVVLLETFSPEKSSFTQAKPPKTEDIPKLAHQLDRVLFSPGVHYLQDPRTRIFNFDPHLRDVVSLDDFDFSKIETFVSAEKDKTLLAEATRQNCRFYSSTLSMTLTLHQFYLFLNNYDIKSDKRFQFPVFSRTCMLLPLSVIVHPKGKDENGELIYSITLDKSADVEILLGAMGHCLEVFLTHSPEELQYFLKKKDNKSDSEATTENADKEEKETDDTASNSANKPANVYNYLKFGDFLMRSQLDCYDSRLPGNGTFDLKTRACCAVRYDKNIPTHGSDYQIWKSSGKYESFEREFNDLIRTGALLKYGFQARIGQMDGIFVAYHNVNSIFGFQYLPLLEIDLIFYSDNKVMLSIEERALHEKQDNLPSVVAEDQFKTSLQMWLDVIKTAISDLKGSEHENQPFRLVMKHIPNLPARAKDALAEAKEKQQAKREAFLQAKKTRAERAKEVESNFAKKTKDSVEKAEKVSVSGADEQSATEEGSVVDEATVVEEVSVVEESVGEESSVVEEADDQHLDSDLYLRLGINEQNIAKKVEDHLAPVQENVLPAGTLLLSLHAFAVPLSPGRLGKLQSYSDNFETSFRAEISPEKREENLIAYKEALDKYNKELVQMAPVLHYLIEATVSMTGRPKRHPFPHSVDEKATYTYAITSKQTGELESDPESVEQYLEIVQSMSNTLVMGLATADNSVKLPDIAANMRRLGEVGRRRKEQWAAKEQPVQRFELTTSSSL